VPVDVYEWLHVFECLLRAGELSRLDLRSLLYRPPHAGEHRWSELARQRMRADYLRTQAPPPTADLDALYTSLTEEYDRGGLPYERALTRLGHARWLLAAGRPSDAEAVNRVSLDLARRYRMGILAADAHELEASIARAEGASAQADAATRTAGRLRDELGYRGPGRP
jgi:hypothetical protein